MNQNKQKNNFKNKEKFNKQNKNNFFKNKFENKEEFNNKKRNRTNFHIKHKDENFDYKKQSKQFDINQEFNHKKWFKNKKQINKNEQETSFSNIHESSNKENKFKKPLTNRQKYKKARSFSKNKAYRANQNNMQTQDLKNNKHFYTKHSKNLKSYNN